MPAAVYPVADQESVAKESSPEHLSLSSLRPACRLERQWIGSVFDLPWGVWLRCDEGEPTLVTHPRNLLGKVQIESTDQALEFVRFFTSPYRHEMFDLDGSLEITASEDDWGQNILKLLPLKEKFHAPRVTSRSGQGLCVGPAGDVSPCDRTEYSIERIVVQYDNNVYEVLETVTEDGFYTLCSQRLILEDLSQFGLLHLPPY